MSQEPFDEKSFTDIPQAQASEPEEVYDEILADQEIPESSRTTNARAEFLEWVEAIITSVVAVIILFTFVFRIVGVEGISMMPTLHGGGDGTMGDRIILTHLFYTPQQGDIVVVTKPDTNTDNVPIIKRVIATEGQTVDINYDEGKVYVDGQELDEPYINEPTYHQGDVDFPVTVPEGCVFVMGDNRNHSLDSRFSSVGMVDNRYILGKAIFRILPFDRMGVVN